MNTMEYFLRELIMLSFPWAPAIHATAYNIHRSYIDVAIIMLLDIIWTTALISKGYNIIFSLYTFM